MNNITVRPATGHNRFAVFDGIPVAHPTDLSRLKVEIRYLPDPATADLSKALALDGHVVPAIHRAVNNHTRLVNMLTRLTEKVDRAHDIERGETGELKPIGRLDQDDWQELGNLTHEAKALLEEAQK